MRFILFSILFFVLIASINANSVAKYTKSKEGLTLVTFYSGKEDSLVLNAFFERLLRKVKRDKNTTSVLLLVDYNGIKRNYRGPGFAAIAIDTLREIDVSFINAYYYHRLGKDFDYYFKVFEPYPSNSYLIDREEPLDLNASFDTTPDEIGLKIMYNYSMADSVICFDRIYTLVQYAMDNIESIRKNQRRMIMDYEYGSAKVSFVTIDTSLINKLPLLSLGFDPKDLAKTSYRNTYLISGVVAILIILISVYVSNQRRLKRRRSTTST